MSYVLQGICACISAIWFEIINDVTKISFLFPTATIWLAGSAVADIMIAVTMVVLVRFLHSSLFQHWKLTLPLNWSSTASSLEHWIYWDRSAHPTTHSHDCRNRFRDCFLRRHGAILVPQVERKQLAHDPCSRPIQAVHQFRPHGRIRARSPPYRPLLLSQD